MESGKARNYELCWKNLWHNKNMKENNQEKLSVFFLGEVHATVRVKDKNENITST